jgi:iron(III) transport system substrate-binding protein
MRIVDLAAGLMCLMLALPAHAQGFAIEEERLYPGRTGAVVQILSTADLSVFEPFIERFQARNPDLGLRYVTVSSATLYDVLEAGGAFDVAISSAMDLQFRLANDGRVQAHQSAATLALPDWARWRDALFAFAAEPAVAVISRARWGDLPRPQTRQQLIAVMRDNSHVFQGAVGTYDVRESGLGYLFATQESRNSDIYWRLSDLMGRLGAELYCCSAQMIDAVARGDLAMAYNVLGSYTAERLASDDRLEILPLQDYATIMLRTVLIPQAAPNPAGARAFVDALLAQGMRAQPGGWVLPPLTTLQTPGASAYGPIRLGPELLVYLDSLNRRAFVTEWQDAMIP